MPIIVDEIHVGDIGTAIIATFYKTDGTIRDISSFTTITLIFSKPNISRVPTVVTFTGSLVTDGTDGQAQYITTSASDLDVSGTWQIQGLVQKTGSSHKSNIVEFKVCPNIN